MKIEETKESTLIDKLAERQVSRRKFMSFAGVIGASAAVIGVAASCKKDNTTTNTSGGVSLGSGDIGILNYAYALEQLEAAFYTKVVASPYSGISTGEMSLLTDIRDHEIAHREFFKAALSTNAIAGLSVDFSSINFTSRDSVLATAKAFEDLGVSAYNGAGRLITDVKYLALAGKIVSVEARHASWIRDVISYGSFADSTVVDANGLDLARKPADVLAIAGKYVTTPIDASKLPS